MARKFKWDAWNFDCEGDAYVIAKQECPDKDNVPDYIIQADCLLQDCKNGNDKGCNIDAPGAGVGRQGKGKRLLLRPGRPKNKGKGGAR